MKYLAREVKLIETENRIVEARGWRERITRNYCLTDMKFQFGIMKTVVEMEGNDDYTTINVNVLNARELHS